MACLFLAVIGFDALIYKNEQLRFSLFGFEESWLHKQELEKLRARLNLCHEDIEQGRFDNLTRHSIEDTHRMMERIYTAVTEIYPKSGYPEAGIGAIQKRLDEILDKISGSDKVFTYSTPQGHTTTVHMNSSSKFVDEKMKKNILSQLEKTEKSIKSAIAQQKAAHKYEAIEMKLFAGQIDQILDRTEILETFRGLLHKYTALMENCEGDLVEVLKFDDLLSQDITSLKLGGDIVNPLIKNGFDTIATLVMNDEASEIVT